MTNPRTPVIVGVSQFLNRIDCLEDALEPLEMMLRAVRVAERDTGSGGVLDQVQSVRVVRGLWRYGNRVSKLWAGFNAVAVTAFPVFFGVS